LEIASVDSWKEHTETAAKAAPKESLPDEEEDEEEDEDEDEDRIGLDWCAGRKVQQNGLNIHHL